MLSTPFQLSTRNTCSVCWCCVVVVFIDIGVVALVSSSPVSACLRQCGFDTDHNFISCVSFPFLPSSFMRCWLHLATPLRTVCYPIV